MAQLSNGPYLYRYPPEIDDGAPGTPGADLVASFWAVRALAALGRWEEAHDRMETLCGLGRPLGLLGERGRPLSGRAARQLPVGRAPTWP